MPQDVELFDGTIRENITRMKSRIEDDAVLAATRKSGAHALIMKQKFGHATQLGEGGARLSGGERQRIGLARAVFGDPVIVVLDEPNSNLDRDGDAALDEAIRGLKKQGHSVVIIAHRPSAVAHANKILLLKQGRVDAYGSKDQVLNFKGKGAAVDGPARKSAANLTTAHKDDAPAKLTEKAQQMYIEKTDAPTQIRPAATGTLGWIVAGVACSIVMLGGIIIWGATATTDGAVIAQGQISVETKRKAIQHLEGGVISDISVEDGAYVNAGDGLIKLDQTAVRSELAPVEDRKLSLIARRSRLEAELALASQITWPQAVTFRLQEPRIRTIVLHGTSLFEARKLRNTASMDLLSRRMDALDAQIKQTQLLKVSNGRERSLLTQELTGLRDLRSQGLVTTQRLLELERDATSLDGLIQGATTQVQSLSAQRA